MSTNEPNMPLDSDEVVIVDLAPEQKRQAPRLLPSRLHLRRGLRWTMLLLTLAGMLVLFLFLRPTLFPQERPSQQPTNTSSFSPAIYTDLFIDQGLVYIYTTNGEGAATLDVVRTRDGHVQWHYPDPVTSLPQLLNGVLYVSTSAGLTALHADTHQVLWQHPQVNLRMDFSDDAMTHPALLYTTSLQGSGLIALHTGDGTIAWQRDDISNLWLSSSNTLFANSMQSPMGLVALRASDGTDLWRYPTTDEALPYLSGDTLCIQSPAQRTIGALDVHTGKLLWQQATSGRMISAENGGVYVLDQTNGLQSLRAEDGKLLWSKHVSMQKLSLYTTPATLYISSLTDGTLQALHARDGTLLWQIQAGGVVGQDADGLLYIIQQAGQNNYNIDARRASDGTLLWHATSNGYITDVEHGIVYIATQENGTVTALNAHTGALLWRYTPHLLSTPAPTQGGITVVTVQGTYVPRKSYQPNP